MPCDEIRRADAHDVREGGVREIRTGVRCLTGVQRAEQQPCGDPVPATAADVVPAMQMVAAVGGRGLCAIRAFAQNPWIVADRTRKRGRGRKQTRKRVVTRRVERRRVRHGKSMPVGTRQQHDPLPRRRFSRRFLCMPESEREW